MVPLKSQSLSICKSSQDSKEHVHIRLLFKGRRYCAARKRAEASVGGPVTPDTVPQGLCSYKDMLCLQIELPRCVQWISASGKLKAEGPKGGLFLLLWSRSPAWPSSQIQQVKTISKQVLTGGARGESDFQQHIINPTLVSWPRVRPDVQASPRLSQSSHGVLYHAAPDNLKSRKGQDYGDSLHS